MDESKRALVRAPIAHQPKPPRYLSSASKAWFPSVVSAFVMEPSDLLVLARACEQFDLAEEARRTLVAEGKYLRDDRKGMKYPHPAIKIQRDATTLLARLIRDLRLDTPPVKAPGRPPGPGPSTRRS